MLCLHTKWNNGPQGISSTECADILYIASDNRDMFELRLKKAFQVVSLKDQENKNFEARQKIPENFTLLLKTVKLSCL